jgi:outer membrane protein
MRKIFSVLIVLLFPILASAEMYTLAQVQEKAMKNNPEIIKAQKALDAAGARRYSGVTGFLPKASVGGMYSHLNEEPPSIDFSAIMMGQTPDIEGNPLLQYRFQDNYSGYIRLTQPLFTGGRNLALLKTSHYAVIAAEAGLELAKGMVNSGTIRGYYGMLVTAEMEKLSQEAIKQLQRHFDRVKNLKASGMATEYDSLKTEVRLLSWTPKLKQAIRERKNSQRRLAMLMGMEPDAEIKIQGDLKPETKEFVGINIDESIKRAVENRPEAIIAKQMYESYVEKKRIQASFMLPQANLQYNYNYLSNKDTLDFSNDSWDQWWDVKVMVNWEFFSFGGNAMNVKAAWDDADKMKKSYEDTIAKIKAEVFDIIEYREETTEAVNVWDKNLKLSQKGYEIAENKYKNGTITKTEFLDSHLEQIEAKVQYYKSLLEYKVAQAEFERITMSKSDTKKNVGRPVACYGEFNFKGEIK